MLSAKESGFNFEFRVKAYNYDEIGSAYSQNNFCGNSAINFLAMDKRNIYFIEVKTAEYFNTQLEKLDEKICKIYRNFIDSIALVSMSENEALKPYSVRLKNSSPKFILILSDTLPIDMLIIYYEKIKKQLSKKLKRLNSELSFFLETENNYNAKLYGIKVV